MKKKLTIFAVAASFVMIAGAFFVSQPSAASASGQTCSIYDPTLRKWWCPSGSVCGSFYGDCLVY